MVKLSGVHLSRVIGPFFLGAVFMYCIQILYSYPSLDRYSGYHYRRALDGDTYDHVSGYRIHRRHGWKNIGKYHHGKASNADRMLKTFKRELPKQNKYELILNEVNRMLVDDLENNNDDLVIDPKLNSSTEEDNDQKTKHLQTRKDTPLYNKDITIPKHKHYLDEPVDAHKYNYIHKPDVCSKADGRRTKVLLIFMVTTAPMNFERRMLVRNTYGNKRNWPTLSAGVFKTVFLLGAVSNKTLQNNIHNESETYKDIVQEDFIDSYANLTLKTVMGLKWVTNFCRQAKYTMKIDDDSMIHQNRILHLLKNSTAVRFTAAETLMNAPVIRNTSSKYYISKEYYPAHTYPPYLNGPGYLLSTDLTEGIYKVAVTTPLFPWEDVFLGICLKKLGVTPKLYHDFILIIAEENQIRNKTKAVKLFKYFSVVSNLEPDYMKLMWTNCRPRIKTVKQTKDVNQNVTRQLNTSNNTRD